MSLPPQTSEAISHNLNCIAGLFKPGAKLTLLVRNPGVEGDADALFTNDEFSEIIAAIEKRRDSSGGQTG